MTAIASWNIQAGRGVDGRVDPVRIARTVRALADADVICLQEVESRGSGGPGDDTTSVREDQFETIQDLFPGYAAVIGAGVERADNGTASMYRFGNHRQWPDGAHCRDFFLVTEELQARLRSLRADLRTDASDYQPIVLVLSDGLGDAGDQVGNQDRHGGGAGHPATSWPGWRARSQPVSTTDE